MKNIAAIASDLLAEVSALRAELAAARDVVEASKEVIAFDLYGLLPHHPPGHGGVVMESLMRQVSIYDKVRGDGTP